VIADHNWRRFVESDPEKSIFDLDKRHLPQPRKSVGATGVEARVAAPKEEGGSQYANGGRESERMEPGI